MKHFNLTSDLNNTHLYVCIEHAVKKWKVQFIYKFYSFFLSISSKTATEFLYKNGIYSDVEYNIINNYVQGGEIN